MRIQAAMSGDEYMDWHEHDLVMPGFRFYPTEEELIEFYLRRKVEGKRFNMELITFLDLYRYDPWELPALAAIGENEWFFFVPRDRKYRNGDRPNRVTTSGYWKATGADRMIRTENLRSIGLKKTLVFYTGKAPKGIRTGWIMNEYRLPHSETARYQKAEISLCRVYKRSGVNEHRHLPSTLPYKPSSSRGTGCDKKHSAGRQPVTSNFATMEGDASPEAKNKKMLEVSGRSSVDNNCKPVLHNHIAYGGRTTPTTSLSSTTSMEDDGNMLHHSKSMGISVPIYALQTSTSSLMTADTTDELNRIVGYNPSYLHQPDNFLPFPLQHQLVSLHPLPANTMPSISDKQWDLSPFPEAGRDHCTSFNW